MKSSVREGPLDVAVRHSGGDWSVQDAAETYRFRDWGDGYFGVSEAGTLQVYPERSPSRALDLMEIVEGLDARGLKPPFVLRFPDLLKHRMTEIAGAFRVAIDDVGYRGSYSCIYPIKVNQQRHLCEQICKVGRALGFGIEVGSKPELLAGLALTAGQNTMPLVCNGFKDEEFIETVIVAAKMGRNVIPVVEQFHELERIVRHARAHSVRPRIGVRLRLSEVGEGRWAASSGARGKFGLSVTQVLAAVEYLSEHDMLDSLRLLHCHVGSQLYDIRTVKHAVSEVARLYTELVRHGAPLDTLDVGGGMAVDYDGTGTATDSSANYTVEQYAMDVVHRVGAICDEAGVAHPDLFSESGRALISHSSAIVCEAVGSRRLPEVPNHELLTRALTAESVPQPLQDILEAYERSEQEADPGELFNDAAYAFGEAMSLFNLGHMDVTARAAVEELYWCIGRRLLDGPGTELPEGLAALAGTFADLYFVNLSVFQSLADSWAIEQVFPIMPIHRLDERPTRSGVLADITCDSDGIIERFPSAEGVTSSMRLHELQPRPPDGLESRPYYLGVFLTGAYQETLGDLHNLFGDTNAVHVVLDAEGNWRIDEVIEGDSVNDVLGFVQYDADAVREVLRKDTEQAYSSGRLSLEEAVSLRRLLDEGLKGYTYLE